MKVYIYTLEHPITNEVRYVGKTKNPKERFHNHCNKLHNQRSHKRNWINSLKSLGLKPKMNILDEVYESEWKYWEKYWIEQFRQWGFNLTNHTSGGDGLTSGNNTSFKKGHISWNNGLANTEICPICCKEFRRPKSNKQLTCSIKCSLLIKKESETIFKKGSFPWNKGIKGYSTTKKGTFLSEEQKQKISNKLKGKPSAKKRIVKQLDMNNNLINEFASIVEAKQVTGIKGISNALTGRVKTAGGYIWL